MHVLGKYATVFNHVICNYTEKAECDVLLRQDQNGGAEPHHKMDKPQSDCCIMDIEGNP
jgi:hypothetical protein